MRPLDVLAATLAGEGRGQDQRFLFGVAMTIHTRTFSHNWKRDRRSRGDFIRVCTAPWQFSCWNRGDANFDLVQSIATRTETWPPSLRRRDMPLWLWRCYAVADLLLDSGPTWSLIRPPGLAVPIPAFDFYHRIDSRPGWMGAETTPLWTYRDHDFYILGPDGVPDTGDEPERGST